jgi:hypothetical protein
MRHLVCHRTQLRQHAGLLVQTLSAPQQGQQRRQQAQQSRHRRACQERLCQRTYQQQKHCHSGQTAGLRLKE